MKIGIHHGIRTNHTVRYNYWDCATRGDELRVLDKNRCNRKSCQRHKTEKALDAKMSWTYPKKSRINEIDEIDEVYEDVKSELDAALNADIYTRVPSRGQFVSCHDD
jgi:hypothetical protein